MILPTTLEELDALTDEQLHQLRKELKKEIDESNDREVGLRELRSQMKLILDHRVLRRMG